MGYKEISSCLGWATQPEGMGPTTMEPISPLTPCSSSVSHANTPCTWDRCSSSSRRRMPDLISSGTRTRPCSSDRCTADLPQAPGLLRRPHQPRWSLDKDVELDYHLRRSALPEPGQVRDLLRADLPVAQLPARPPPPAVGGPPRRGSAGRAVCRLHEVPSLADGRRIGDAAHAARLLTRPGRRRGAGPVGHWPGSTAKRRARDRHCLRGPAVPPGRRSHWHRPR